ncbi:MAG TPA: DNA-binding protein [Chloroflexia bacterium]
MWRRPESSRWYQPTGGTATKRNHDEQQESDLPAELARPARRALAGAGYTRLAQLTAITEAEVKQLHGMGPKAIDQLRRALGAQGLTFRTGK